MTDKVQKIREEVEKIKTVHSSVSLKDSKPDILVVQVCINLLSFIDSLQEEPVNIWHDASEEQPEEYRTVVAWHPTKMDGEVIPRCVEVYKGRIWAYIDDILNLSNVERTVKNWKEPVSEDLGEYINELSKQFPEVSFAKLSRIAVKVAKWQKQKTLDKACNFLEMLGQGFTITDEITHNTYKVEQLITDFKKYMED